MNNLLAKSQNLTEGEIAGIRIVQNAIRIPLMKICENAGFEGSLIAAKLTEGNNYESGFNAANGKYVDMRK